MAYQHLLSFYLVIRKNLEIRYTINEKGGQSIERRRTLVLFDEEQHSA